MLSKVIMVLAVFGLVTTGALDVQRTAQYISYVVVALLSGGQQSQQQYEIPIEQPIQPTSEQ